MVVKNWKVLKLIVELLEIVVECSPTTFHHLTINYMSYDEDEPELFSEDLESIFSKLDKTYTTKITFCIYLRLYII